MNKTIISVFEERKDAENAINGLQESGFNPKDISIVMKDKKEAEELSDNTGTDVAGGAVSGATTGALVGGLAGLIASFVIPGLGAFLIGGPIAAALGLGGAAAATVSGAATGAVAGGLIGALTGLGLSEDEAKEYEESVKSGAILVAVPVSGEKEDTARELLEKNNATHLRSVSMQEGSTGVDHNQNSKGGRGWHGDPMEHATAAKGKDVPARGKGE